MNTKSIISFVILITLLTIQQTNSQWQQTGLNTGNVSEIAGNDTHIFAAKDFLYYTTDNGASWTDAGISSVSKLCLNETAVFVTKSSSQYVYKSTNYGVNWIPYQGGAADGIGSLGANGNYIYSGLIHYGLLRSTNSGANWSGVGFPSYSVYSIFVSGNNIYTGLTEFGVKISTDNGAIWSQNNLHGQFVTTVAASGNFVYAVTHNGIFISSDNGTTWNQSLNNLSIGPLAVTGNNVFAGSSTGGVYFSNNSGTSWIQINEGLPALDVACLYINGSYIYAGPNGNGVWKRPLSDLLAVHNISAEVPKEYNLFQNYPNPFNPNSKIRFQIAKSGNTKIIVFDVQGKLVSTLVNEELKPGTYEVNFDGGKYASGVYLYKLETGNYSETKKMLMMK